VLALLGLPPRTNSGLMLDDAARRSSVERRFFVRDTDAEILGWNDDADRTAGAMFVADFMSIAIRSKTKGG